MLANDTGLKNRSKGIRIIEDLQQSHRRLARHAHALLPTLESLYVHRQQFSELNLAHVPLRSDRNDLFSSIFAPDRDDRCDQFLFTVRESNPFPQALF